MFPRIKGIISYVIGLVHTKIDPLGFARSQGVRMGKNIHFYGMKPGMFSTEPWLTTLGIMSTLRQMFSLLRMTIPSPIFARPSREMNRGYRMVNPIPENNIPCRKAGSRYIQSGATEILEFKTKLVTDQWIQIVYSK